MSAKWTEGPWYLDTFRGARPGLDMADIHGRQGGTKVCVISGAIRIDGDWHDENYANARLIAAAPDLAEALKNLVGLAKMRGTLTGYGAAIADAEAALAKAGAT